MVYKVDRLTRSLADFAKIVERFDALGVSFVSVTQQFNTTSSMGRLTLNVLLSFAQFEREVTGERIRDKIAASKKKGLWMGGIPPIGYQGNGRVLAIEEVGAQQVQHIYARYEILRCVRSLKQELDSQGIVTPWRNMASGRVMGGVPFSRGQLYRILSHPVYRGMIVHADQVYPGQHPAIIEEDTWKQVQAALVESRQDYQRKRSAPSQSLLVGKLFDGEGRPLIPSHSQKQSKRFRYYVSDSLVTGIREHSPQGIRMPAGELESLVLRHVQAWLRNEQAVLEELSPAAARLQETLSEVRRLADALGEEGAGRFDRLQETLDAVVVDTDAVTIRLRRRFLSDTSGQPRRRASADSDDPVVLRVPVSAQRCGYSLRLLVPGSSQPTMRDERLIQVIRKAIAWRD